MRKFVSYLSRMMKWYMKCFIYSYKSVWYWVRVHLWILSCLGNWHKVLKEEIFDDELYTPPQQTEWNPTQRIFSLHPVTILPPRYRVKFLLLSVQFVASRCDFYVPSIYYLCMFEKGKTATQQKEATWWKICRPGFFFRKPSENIDATMSVTETCNCKLSWGNLERWNTCPEFGIRKKSNKLPCAIWADDWLRSKITFSEATAFKKLPL